MILFNLPFFSKLLFNQKNAFYLLNFKIVFELFLQPLLNYCFLKIIFLLYQMNHFLFKLLNYNNL